MTRLTALVALCFTLRLTLPVLGHPTANPVADPAACPYSHIYGERSETGLKGKRDTSLGDLEAVGLYKPREAAPEPQPDLEERDILGLGGLVTGLLGGLLQPLTGILEAVDIPTPQPQGFALIPAKGDTQHKFKKPGPTDVRGLCPTMNTLANHAYISRTGITTFAEAANAVQTVWGFGYDMSVALSLLGLLAGGDLLSGKYSIGGYDARVPQTLGPAHGINTHGRFEVDASPSRSDTYFGDNHTLNKTRLNAIHKRAAQFSGGHYNAAMGYADRTAAYEESKAFNPEFSATIAYLPVSAATRFFWFRALSNGTTPNDCDRLNFDSFYNEERIPDNWFRRPTVYTAADFLEDVVDFQINSPVLPGQNQGLNNFVPFTTSVPDAPAALLCFLFNEVISVVPEQTADLLTPLSKALVAVAEQIITPLLSGSSSKCDLDILNQ